MRTIELRRAAIALLAFYATHVHGNTDTPQPLHYRISATLTPGSGTGVLTSDVSITIPASEISTTNAFILGRRFDLQPLEVPAGASVRIEPSDEPIERVQKITVRYDRPPGNAIVVRFRYQGPIFIGEKQDRLGYTSEAIEMTTEMTWLPFPAGLNKRFTMDAELRGVPPELMVVAQGDIEHSGDRVRIRRNFPDMDFAWIAVRGLKSMKMQGMELYARDLQGPLSVLLRKHAVGAAQYYQNWFGSFPGGPIRLAVVPRSEGGAYARVGFVVMTEARAHADRPPEMFEMSQAGTVSHEFAHAWWSPDDPFTEDNWLSESIASYASMRYLETIFGREKVLAQFDKARERVAGAGPILGRGRASPVALYLKGPMLLMELEQTIGREQIDSFLGKLGREPPRRTREFLQALEQTAGAEVASNFEARLRAE